MDNRDNGLTDEQLAEIIARRDDGEAAHRESREAFEELYARYAAWLLSFLATRTDRNDLEDVAQVVWQRVWERLPASFTGGKFQVWLYYIARNYLIDRSRRQKVDLMGDSITFLPDRRAPNPAEQIVETERVDRLTRSLQRLGGHAAEVARSRLRGDSYDEICRNLEITRGRAYKLLQQAKLSLTDSLVTAFA